jgi:probable addiction module antidote protein
MRTYKSKAGDLPKFDVIDYLNTDKDTAEYLLAVLDDGDLNLFAAAMKDIARARIANTKICD